jgi:hypothetical protein
LPATSTSGATACRISVAPLQRVEPLDVRPRRAAVEDRLLDRLQFGLERIEHREVAVDHGVHQRVQHEARALAQVPGLALAAFAHSEEAVGAEVAQRQHEVRADEDRDLAEFERRPTQLGQPHHDEQGRAVLLDLRPLVAVARALDRQLVQAELVLHLPQFVVAGIVQRDPDEAAGPLQPLVDGLDRDVGELAPVLVSHAVDQHRRPLTVLTPGRNPPTPCIHRGRRQHPPGPAGQPPPHAAAASRRRHRDRAQAAAPMRRDNAATATAPVRP